MSHSLIRWSFMLSLFLHIWMKYTHHPKCMYRYFLCQNFSFSIWMLLRNFDWLSIFSTTKICVGMSLITHFWSRIRIGASCMVVVNSFPLDVVYSMFFCTKIECKLTATYKYSCETLVKVYLTPVVAHVWATTTF